MPYSYAVYTGNGSTTQFNVSFPYIRREHVVASIDYVSASFTWVNNTTIEISPAPGNGTRVEVRRVTPVNVPLVDFADGSTLVAADLDTNALQQTYINQEQDDQFQDGISINSQGLLDAGAKRITNVGNPTSAQDAATKTYVDSFVSQTANIANGAVTTAKIADANVTTAKIADSNVTTAKIADGNVTSGKIADGNVTTGKIADANVTEAKLANGAVTSAKIADGTIATADIGNLQVTGAKIADDTITSAKLTGATVVTNAEHSASTPNDTSFFTTSASDARYFRQDSSETITSGNPWSSSDSYVATTAAIDARVIDLVDDVGGFVPIENETSFPATNPDINNPDGTGTIISIKEIVTSRTPVGGTVTIANGSGANTVTITGCGSTVLASGFGVLVETTATLHTYAFHRLVPKATEVTTVAGISGDVTTVAGISSNVTSVASNATNINTVATNIANVNNVGGSIASVNSVASNLNTVNDFAARYRVASADPTTSLDTGDLVFNTSANELRVYNGSAWQGGVTATGNLMSKSGDTMTGPLGITTGTNSLPSLFFSGDPNTGLYSPGADQLGITTGGIARLTVAADGAVNVVGSLTQGGNAVVTVGDSGTVTSTMIADGTIVDGDVNASAAIAGSKISPDFGSQNVVTTGTVSGASLIPTGSSVPTNGVYLPSANNVAISTNGTGRLFVDSSGRVLVGTTAAFSTSSDALVQAVNTSGGEIVIGRDFALGSGSTIGRLAFFTKPSAVAEAARIEAVADALHSGGAPSRLVFSTTAASASSPTERMRIDSSGRVGIGTTGPNCQLANTGTTSLGTNEWPTTDIGRSSGRVIAGSEGTIVAWNETVGAGNTAALILGTKTGAGANTIGFAQIKGGTVNSSDRTSFLAFETCNSIGVTSEKARIDSSGRLLVGTSSTSADTRIVAQGNSSGAGSNGRIDIDIAASTPLNNDYLGVLVFGDNAQSTGAWLGARRDGGTWSGSSKPSRLEFSTTADGASSPAERMRITQNGTVIINDTGVAAAARLGISADLTNFNGIVIKNTVTQASGQQYAVFYNSAGNVAGAIQHTGTTTVNYSTSSDYRLKENVVPLTGAAARVNQLKPSQFNFITDPGKTVDGFLAHEAQVVVPECVTGTKDEVDADGNPVYQGIDQSKLVPLLTAALQEALAEIESLKARVTALEP